MVSKKNLSNLDKSRVPCGKGTDIRCSDLFVELFEQRLKPSSRQLKDIDYENAFPGIKDLISKIIKKYGWNLKELLDDWPREKNGSFKNPFYSQASDVLFTHLKDALIKRENSNLEKGIDNLYNYIFKISYWYYLEQTNISRGYHCAVLDDRRRTKSVNYIDLIRELLEMPDLSVWDLLLTTLEPLSKDYAPIAKKLASIPGFRKAWFCARIVHKEERVYICMPPGDSVELKEEIISYIDGIYPSNMTSADSQDIQENSKDIRKELHFKID